MMIVVVCYFCQVVIVLLWDLVFVFVVDEEYGGKYGLYWLVDNRFDLFDGIIEVIGEVGGFLLIVFWYDGGECCLYLIEIVEKGIQWMWLMVCGWVGYGLMVYDQNVVIVVCEVVVCLGCYQFLLVCIDIVVQFLVVVGEEIGLVFDFDLLDLVGMIDKFGLMVCMLKVVLYDIVNFMMFKVGYKVNVVLVIVEVVVDCCVFLGCWVVFEVEVDVLIGFDVIWEWVSDLLLYEIIFDGDLVVVMNVVVLVVDLDGCMVLYMLFGGMDVKVFVCLGIWCFGFSLLCLLLDLDFILLFYGVDEWVFIDGLWFGIEVLMYLLIYCQLKMRLVVMLII